MQTRQCCVLQMLGSRLLLRILPPLHQGCRVSEPAGIVFSKGPGLPKVETVTAQKHATVILTLGQWNEEDQTVQSHLHLGSEFSLGCVRP